MTQTLPKQIKYFTQLLDYLVDEVESREDRIELVRQFWRKSAQNERIIRGVMECLFLPSIEFDLPDGLPKNMKRTIFNDHTVAPMSFLGAIKRVPYFIPHEKNGKFLKNKVKRESIYVQTIEGMYTKDAELFVMMKDKDITGPWEVLDETFWREAFSGVLPVEEEEEEAPKVAPKKRGRPKGSKNKPKTTTTAAKKRGPGRPRKNSQ